MDKPDLKAMAQEELFNVMIENSAIGAIARHHGECKKLIESTESVYEETAAGFCLMKLLSVASANLAMNIGHKQAKAVLKDLQEMIDMLPPLEEQSPPEGCVIQ